MGLFTRYAVAAGAPTEPPQNRRGWGAGSTAPTPEETSPTPPPPEAPLTGPLPGQGIFPPDGRAAFDKEQDEHRLHYGDGAVPHDIGSVRKSRDDLRREYENSQPRTAPTATAPGVTPVAQAGPVDMAPATTAPGVDVGPAAKVGPVGRVVAQTVTAPTIGGPAQVTAGTVAPTAGAQAGAVNAGPQGEFRADQQTALGAYKGVLAGTAPSVAQLQYQRATQDAIAEQASVAAGAHGYGGLFARSQAAANVGKVQQRAALDNALIRAQEQEGARQGLAATAGAARGQDIGIATTEAQLGTQVSVSNADRDAARAMKDADLKAAADAGNAAAINEVSRRNAELGLAASTTTAQLDLEEQRANQQVDLTTGLTNAQAENRMRELQAQLDAQGGQFNAEQINEMEKLRAQLQTQTNLSNTAETNLGARADADAKLRTELANLEAELKTRGMDDEQRRVLLDAYIRMSGQVLAWNTNERGPNKPKSGYEKFKEELEFWGDKAARGGAAYASGGGSEVARAAK